MPDRASDLRRLATQLRAGASYVFLNRVGWVRAAMRIPNTSSLHVRATIIGANLSIGENTRIEELVRLQSGSASHTSEFVKIGNHCSIRANAHIYAMGGSVTIGSHCSVNPYCVLYGTGTLVIGDFVRIAAHTVIVAAMHKFDRRDIPIHKQGSTAKGIVIEDDVWVGAGVTILDGVRVGTGAVLAGGAVVTTDVEPFSIVGGIPARKISSR